MEHVLLGSSSAYCRMQYSTVLNRHLEVISSNRYVLIPSRATFCKSNVILSRCPEILLSTHDTTRDVARAILLYWFCVYDIVKMFGDHIVRLFNVYIYSIDPTELKIFREQYVFLENSERVHSYLSFFQVYRYNKFASNVLLARSPSFVL